MCVCMYVLYIYKMQKEKFFQIKEDINL